MGRCIALNACMKAPGSRLQRVIAESEIPLILVN